MLDLYIIDYFKPQKNNGLSTYVDELIAGFKKIPNLRLNCIWINCLEVRSWEKKSNNELNIVDFYIPRYADSLRRTLFSEDELIKILIDDMLGKQRVIVHFNWINHLSIAYLLKRKANCITILTKHCIPWRDLISTNYKEFYQLNQAFKHRRSMPITNPSLKKEEIFYDSIDHIITVTDCARQSLTQLFEIASNKITVINNGLNNNKLRPRSKREKLRTKYGFSGDEKLILYAGNLNPRKGLIDLVAAFEQLSGGSRFNNVRLILAGPGDHDLILTTAKKYWSKIVLTGSLGKATLYDFYAMADVGVVPSYIEQCSYTAIEMMHSGLPIIVSDVDGLKEIVNADCGMKVKIDFRKKKASINSKDLQSKIAFILENPNDAARLAANAKKHALVNFSTQKMLDKTIAVYDRIWSESEAKKLGFGKKTKAKASSSKPLISVLIPCYNAALHLNECIDSVLAQTFTDFELILINDGATDDTEIIIKQRKDPRIIYTKNRENKGIAYSLNKGIHIAKGKYIARMDADDFMMADRLQLQFDFLEKNMDYGMVGSSHNVIDSKGMPFNRFKAITANGDLKLHALFYNPFSHPTITMRTSLAKQLLYNEEFAHCEDYDLWFRMAEVAKVENLPGYLLNYRVHDQSATAKNQKAMKQNVISLLSRELDKINIEYSSQELMLHAAIGFGYGKKFFNSPERIIQLNNWLDKVFSMKFLTERNTPEIVNQFRKHIIQNCCGL